MDQIKEAFSKVKLDIQLLQTEVMSIKESLSNLDEQISNLTISFNKFFGFNYKSNINNVSAQSKDFKTDISINPTDNVVFKPQKGENKLFSTGNEGVTTDRQTDRQTDRTAQNSLIEASNLLNSLDSIKKEIRLKFKRLTKQELLIFSTIYQFDEEIGYATYRHISERLHLTESSIRDYTARLIKKGILIEKIKMNNKMIQLRISSHLKQVATLSTILNLRDL